MDWKSVIGSVAPLAATALGGPLAGLVVGSLGKIFGVSDPTVKSVQQAIADSSLTGEQIAALRAHEDDLKEKMRELDITEEQLAFADTDSARKMQIANRSLVPAALTFVLVFGFLGILAAGAFGQLKLDANPAMMMLLGSLTGAFGAAIQFWLGTTHESSRKNDVIASQLPQ